MKYLRQSTAATAVVGPFVSPSTGFPVTSITDQSASGRLVKNGTGGAVTVSSWAHDAQGGYLVGLSTSHTDTIGRLRLEFSDGSTYLPVWEDFSVLSAAVYDALFGTVAGDVAIFSGTAMTAVSLTGGTFPLSAVGTTDLTGMVADLAPGVTGESQRRRVAPGYVTSTRVATWDSPLVVSPTAPVAFALYSEPGDTQDGLVTRGVVSASPTTTGFTATRPGGSALPTTANLYVNATSPLEVCWTSGALLGTKFNVTAYSSGVFTVSTMPTAPSTGDAFDVL